MGMSRNAYETLIRKPEGERQVIKGRRRWEYNIKTKLGEAGRVGVDWIHMVEDRD